MRRPADSLPAVSGARAGGGRLRALVSLIGVCTLGLAGCAGSRTAARPTPATQAQAQAQAQARAPEPEPSDASGVWDWLYRSTTQQGDLRLEQEEWHLEQRGSALTGYYTRQVTTLSMDRRPFQCNGLLGFVKTTRVRVLGVLRGDQVELREVGVDVERNPCDESARSLSSYAGRLIGDALTLSLSNGGEQRLVRRLEGSGMASLDGPAPAPASAAQAEAQRQTQAALGAVSIDGVWDWQFRAVDADGDLHTESEIWHITEKNAEIAGYYERTLERVRSSGVFSCSGSPQIRTTTRYTIKGQRFGDKLSLVELDYKLDPSPCENGLRRLDHYQGAVLPEGQIMLTWGNGHQLLKKRR